MKAAQIVSAKCLINDQRHDSFSPFSTRFLGKSSSGINIAVRMLQSFSSNTCSSISLSHLGSSPAPATHLTHCLTPSKSQEGLRTNSTETAGIIKTVRVKFQMKIDCQFGDHILIVGDDPLLGSWSPLNAIPLSWSEGHLWTLVLEMPIEKSFKYKFLLKKSSGEILWQPDPDRVFTFWETQNVIVVSEEWATADAQKISEQHIIDENEELISNTLVDDPVQIVAENITVTASDENVTVNRDGARLHVEASSHLKDDASSNVAKKAVKSSDRNSQKRRLTSKDGHTGLRLEKSSSSEPEGSLVTSDEGPVLVPGLTVMSIDSDKDLVNERQNSILAVDAEKDIVNKHRKSTPTDSEPTFEVYKNQEYHVYRFE